MVSLVTIVCAVWAIALNWIPWQTGAGYIFSSLMAIGFRSAASTEGSKIAVLVAEYLANKQTVDVKTEANKLVQQMITDALAAKAQIPQA